MLNRCGGTGGYPRGETPAARASSPDWPRRAPSAGMKAICLVYYVRSGLGVHDNGTAAAVAVAGGVVDLLGRHLLVYLMRQEIRLSRTPRRSDLHFTIDTLIYARFGGKTITESIDTPRPGRAY